MSWVKIASPQVVGKVINHSRGNIAAAQLHCVCCYVLPQQCQGSFLAIDFTVSMKVTVECSQLNTPSGGMRRGCGGCSADGRARFKPPFGRHHPFGGNIAVQARKPCFVSFPSPRFDSTLFRVVFVPFSFSLSACQVPILMRSPPGFTLAQGER